MQRILAGFAAIAAAGALAYAGPARACGDQQKTTTAKAEEQKAQPQAQQKTAAAKPAGKDVQAQQQKTAGAQAKADTGAVKTEQQQK